MQAAPKSAEKPLQWWKIHEGQFPTVVFLARQILGIVGSQIETERVFSIAGVLMALCRCRLGSKKSDQLVLLIKNWPDDPREGCGAKCLNDFGDKESDLIDQIEDEFEEGMVNLVEACPEDIEI